MDFKEIPDNARELGPRFHDAINISNQIGPAAEFIGKNLHNGSFLKPGEKWTLVLAMTCGYHLEIEMRVHNLGDCAPQEEEKGPASERSVIFGVRKDGVRIPFAAPSIMKPHELYRRAERNNDGRR